VDIQNSSAVYAHSRGVEKRVNISGKEITLRPEYLIEDELAPPCTNI
jgi:hypothetical protein